MSAEAEGPWLRYWGYCGTGKVLKQRTQGRYWKQVAQAYWFRFLLHAVAH